MLGTTASTDLGFASGWATYSYINCKLSSQCSVDLGSSRYVFIDLTSAAATSASPHTITITGLSELLTLYGGNTYPIYPVIYANSAQYTDITVSLSSDAMIDCYGSTSCIATLINSVRNTQLYPSMINCTMSTGCQATCTNNPACYLRCDGSTSCTALIKDT